MDNQVDKTAKILVGLALFTAILAFLVVILGAYTRLKDSGLGCPDWPGCYHQVMVPMTKNAIQQAQKLYPTKPVQINKAWIEMVHRYAACLVGLLIIVLGILSIHRKMIVPMALVILVIFQVTLGMWTVTTKLLPIVVMAHLLGGLTILSLLWWFHLRVGNYFLTANIAKQTILRSVAIIGLSIVILQIILGSWTSANYAALVCPNFPFCSSAAIFHSNFKEAFNFLHSGHVLSHSALATIQMTHRTGGLITAICIGALSIYLILMKNKLILQKLGIVMLLLLIVQLGLGIMNIEFVLPLPIAILHHTIAAMLLLTMVTFTYISFCCGCIE